MVSAQSPRGPSLFKPLSSLWGIGSFSSPRLVNLGEPRALPTLSPLPHPLSQGAPILGISVYKQDDSKIYLYLTPPPFNSNPLLQYVIWMPNRQLKLNMTQINLVGFFFSPACSLLHPNLLHP